VVWFKIEFSCNTETVAGASYKSQAGDENELQDLYTAIRQAAMRRVSLQEVLILLSYKLK
jgi:hypothetical protein